jgi:hypothetical protein
MAFIVIHRRESKASARELKRIADALEQIADYLRPPETTVEDIEITSIERFKPETEQAQEDLDRQPIHNEPM